jgi:hypothetical protein
MTDMKNLRRLTIKRFQSLKSRSYPQTDELFARIAALQILKSIGAFKPLANICHHHDDKISDAAFAAIQTIPDVELYAYGVLELTDAGDIEFKVAAALVGKLYLPKEDAMHILWKTFVKVPPRRGNLAAFIGGILKSMDFVPHHADEKFLFYTVMKDWDALASLGDAILPQFDNSALHIPSKQTYLILEKIGTPAALETLLDMNPPDGSESEYNIALSNLTVKVFGDNPVVLANFDEDSDE